MKYTSIFFSGVVVWALQLIFSDLLAISTVRPDFCLILVLYWSFQYSRSIVIILGFLMGLFVWLFIGILYSICSFIIFIFIGLRKMFGFYYRYFLLR